MTKLFSLRVAAVTTLTLVGCSTLPPPQKAPEKPLTRAEPAARSLPTPAPDSPVVSTDPSRSRIAAARKQAAQPRRAINVQASCLFRDETGYNGHLDLLVRDDDVRSLDAEVNVPKHGSCHFALKDFRQNGSRSSIELNAAGSRCSVRMWEQGARVSVAFSNCAVQCSGGAHEYLWPILVDTGSGRCS
jgi:hypothetical protein